MTDEQMDQAQPDGPEAAEDARPLPEDPLLRAVVEPVESGTLDTSIGDDVVSGTGKAAETAAIYRETNLRPEKVGDYVGRGRVEAHHVQLTGG